MKMKLTFAGVGFLLVLAVSVTSCRTVMPPLTEWYEEDFEFTSGPYVYVFRQPKLVIFLGDGGEEEIFDRVGSVGFSTGPVWSSFSGSGTGQHTRGKVQTYSRTSGKGKMTMRFLDGKHVIVIALHGEQFELTLADGRTFTLDGKTPLWLRCKSDGTVVELDKLPDGFVEFFESPPDNPGFIETIESYPDAFRK